MRPIKIIHYVSVAAALTLLAACASAPAYTATPSPAQVSARPAKAGYHGMSFNACPAMGALVYASDSNDGTVNIFAGNLHGQSPCGIITIGHFAVNGLMVKAGDLYVTKGPPFPQVKAFHRGETSPFMVYFDATCGVEVPSDVTVSDDGYVFASNSGGTQCSSGSISVWKKSTGAFVANYPNASGQPIHFLTIQKDGTVYYDDDVPGLWVGTCIKGACGEFTNTGAVFRSPGGIRSADDEHVVLNDQAGIGGGRVLTYAPPLFGTPSGNCSLASINPVGIDINFKENHIFVADAGRGIVKEFKYPAGGGDGHQCVLIGSVSTSGGFPVGIAVARPESL